MKLTGKSCVMVLLVLLAFMAAGCGKENANDQISPGLEQEQSHDISEQENATSETVSAAKEAMDETMPAEEETPDEVTGLVLIGNQGSGITLYDDGKADYYWTGQGLVEEGALWSREDDIITIHLTALMCDIYADYGGESKTLIFKSDSANWDEEVFIPISTTKNKLLAEDYKKLIEQVYEAVASKSAIEESGEGSEDQQSSEETSGGIRPEVKEFLDSYETFMDEYCEFMKNYTNSDNALSMLNDYAKIMQKYLEFSEKLGALDSQDMNTEEMKYYTEVTLRVSQKLLEVSE